MAREKILPNIGMLLFCILLIVPLNGFETLAQDPNPETYFIYLPIIFRAPTDPRYDYARGSTKDCCEDQLNILNLRGIGLHLHQLVPANGAQVFQVAEWYDWYNAYQAPPHIPKHPCVWSRTTNTLPTPTQCVDWIQTNPGKVWVIGNEPNLTLSSSGGSLTYQQYAKMYHDAASLIRVADPTARVAVASVGGGKYQSDCSFWLYDPFEWLEHAIKEHKMQYGPMAVDLWTLHVYNKESRPDTSEEKHEITCFRHHMLSLRNRGYWIGPYELWITELGWHGWYEADQTYANVSAYMIDMTQWLEGRPDVGRWFWWPWGAGTALIEAGEPTSLGQLYSGLAK